MDAIDLLELVGAMSLAGAAASVAVVALAPRLRRWAGAACAYRLWLAVPLAMLAVLLPARTVVVAASGLPAAATGDGAARAVDAAAGALPVPAASGIGGMLLLAWIAGACFVTWRSLRAHRRYLDALGPLRARGDGLFESPSRQGLPAVVGLRARIVLPADFDTRYSDIERPLVLAHERAHVARRDVWWNAFAALLCALHWFNPVARWALRRFRIDQELACDAEVLARMPERRRSYGEALMKAQLSAFPGPLACQWPETHPLKERIEMLGMDLPPKSRRIAGATLAIAVSAVFASAVWAARPPEQVHAGAGPAMQADPAELSGRVAAERAAAAAGVRLLNPEALDAAPSRAWIVEDIPALTLIDMIAAGNGLEAVREPGGVRFVPAGPDRLTYDAKRKTLQVRYIERSHADLLRDMAKATGRRLEAADGVDLSQKVTLRFESVPVGIIESIIDSELEGARLESDDKVIRVVASPGKKSDVKRKSARPSSATSS